MGLNTNYIEGQTPIDEDEKKGLRISSITTREELDEFEQLNIERALEWTLTRKFRKEDILLEQFVKELHSKMFDSVWKWAGKYRTSNKNIGVEWQFVSVSLKQLLDDCKFWIENKTYAEDEISVRFSHRLVSIHCFSNGNGRHSRLMADVIISQIFNEPVFSWGSEDLVKQGEVRKKYINAIQEADKGDINPLLEFARS
jgi:Fic-DOC domain mobile mystery protein B